jgi:hypothetical protein
MKLLISLIIIIVTTVYASEKESDHGHTGKEEESHNEAHEDEHEEKVELPSGILSFNDEKGEFTLKPNVIRNFGIKSQVYVPSMGVVKIPLSALVRSLQVTSIYLEKNSVFKAVNVVIIQTQGDTVTVKPALPINDSRIIFEGANYLKTIHQSLEEGPSEGHGH